MGLLRLAPVTQRKLRAENENTGQIDRGTFQQRWRPVREIKRCAGAGEVDHPNDGIEAEEWHQPGEVPGVVRWKEESEGNGEQHGAREIRTRASRAHEDEDGEDRQ